jgi:23S rRNA (guanosine2251-2'-O)-methyltransferase
MSKVEGRNPVLEAVRGRMADRVLVDEGSKSARKIEEIVNLARSTSIHVEFVTRRELDKISETGHHQGVLAFIVRPSYVSIEKVLSEVEGDICVVILDRVQDPMNLGSVLRTAEATGVNAVVIPRRGGVGLTPAVRRAAMGGDVYVPVVRERPFRVLRSLKEEGIKVVGVETGGGVDYFNERLTGSVAFILGGEGGGLSQQMMEKCDVVVRIPMSGRLDSLNVGVAAAVVLYERVRQLSGS